VLCVTFANCRLDFVAGLEQTSGVSFRECMWFVKT